MLCFEIDLLERRAGEGRGPSFGADGADLWDGGGGGCVLRASIALVALVERLELSGVARTWAMFRLWIPYVFGDGAAWPNLDGECVLEHERVAYRPRRLVAGRLSQRLMFAERNVLFSLVRHFGARAEKCPDIEMLPLLLLLRRRRRTRHDMISKERRRKWNVPLVLRRCVSLGSYVLKER